MADEQIPEVTVTAPRVTPGSSSDIATLKGDRARALDEATTRQEALDKQIKSNIQAEDKSLSPLEAQASKATAELGELKPPAETPIPEWKPKPLIDAKEYQSFSFALLGLALIGGATSKGNWLGVSSALNGALKGYYDGAQDRAAREYEDYKAKFAEAKAHDEMVQRRFKDTLESKQLSINAILSQIRIDAAKYGRQDMLMAAEQKSIDNIWKRVEATDQAIARIDEGYYKTDMQFQATMARVKQAGGGMQYLDNFGKWVAEQTMLGGDTQFTKMLQSRYGGQIGAMVLNDIGRQMYQNGEDPRQLIGAAATIRTDRSALTQATNRLNGVERLTGAIKPLENELAYLVQKVNGAGVKPVNATLNWVKKGLGDKDYSELVTIMGSVGRQYIEAMTMPGSNAQLHATSQDWADGVFDPNMNIPALQGVLKAMNLEISSTHSALVSTVEKTKYSATAQGSTLPGPGGAPAPGPGPAPAGPTDTPTPGAAPGSSAANPMSLDDYIKAHSGADSASRGSVQ